MVSLNTFKSAQRVEKYTILLRFVQILQYMYGSDASRAKRAGAMSWRDSDIGRHIMIHFKSMCEKMPNQEGSDIARQKAVRTECQKEEELMERAGAGSPERTSFDFLGLQVHLVLPILAFHPLS